MEVAEKASKKLVRKQFLIHPDQIKKLQRLARDGETSAADMVRKAIDAYSPDVPMGMDDSELLDLVSERVKEAIADTRKTREKLGKTFKKLGIEGE